MKVHDLRGDGARLRRRRRRLPDRPIELLDQVLIDSGVRRVRLEQRVGGAQPVSFRHSAANGSNCASTTRSLSGMIARSEEHTSELQSRLHLVCRLLLEKKKNNI